MCLGEVVLAMVSNHPVTAEAVPPLLEKAGK